MLNDSSPNASDNASTEESDAKSDNSKEKEPLLSSEEAGDMIPYSLSGGSATWKGREWRVNHSE